MLPLALVLPSLTILVLDLVRLTHDLLNQFANSLPDLIHQLGGQAWAPHHQDLTPQNLHRAHQLGLITNTLTVNNHKKIKHLSQTPVDGIITDYVR